MDAESIRAPVLRAYQEGPEAVVSCVGTLLSERPHGASHGAGSGERALGGPSGNDQSQQWEAALLGWTRRQAPPEQSTGAQWTGVGGQLGHAGQTAWLVATPDAVEVQTPAPCGGCGRLLQPVSLGRSGDQAGRPQRPGGALRRDGGHIRDTLAWLHVASTPRLTFYAVHPKRGRVAMDALDVLPRFRGRTMHDGLTSYGQYAQCAHAQCNAHHLRELTFVEEQLGQGWAATLKAVLGEGKQVVDAARARGEAGLPEEVRQEFARRYDAALEEGARANPPAPPTGTRGRPTRGKAGNLVDRLRAHKEATLAFLSDTTIPFDNNQAERDIRMTRVREKISGCFRTPTGGARFCRIRGDISTLRQQGQPIFAALGQALAGDLLLPLTC